MRASLDTNVLIHLYRAERQEVLFSVFEDGVFIYEQIRDVELAHHGQDVIEKIDQDIASGRIRVYTKEMLSEQSVLSLFNGKVRENRLLYGPGDLGEVYAISLAETIGAYYLVTDDVKQGGPYMSLLQLDYDIIPFTFAEVLFLRYLMGKADAEQTVRDFNEINCRSQLNWSMRSKLAGFIKRFWECPYKEEEKLWRKKFVLEYGVRARSMFQELRQCLKDSSV